MTGSTRKQKRSIKKMTNKFTSFHFLFLVQFLLVAAGIFINVKVGLFTLIFTILFSIICLIQLGLEKNTDWKNGHNVMVYLFLVWLFYYIIELFNPNCVKEAWYINAPPYVLIPLVCAFLVPLVIRNTKGIEYLLFIWSAFVIIITIKGYWQKNHGFNERELYFLYTLGGWRTHIIWSGIRYFSCFSDAANYGVHSAMSAVVFGISAFFVTKKWKQFFFLFIAACALYGMAISGTRAAVGVIAGGLLLIIFIAKNKKVLFTGIFTLIVTFFFFYFTNIGNENQYVYKMRSAFHPTKDASYQLRIENREKMKILMAEKPIGYGIGLSKAGNFDSKEKMPYPPDSWLVSVWVESGIIGITMYLFIHGFLFIWCSYYLIFKIKDKYLRGLVSAWLSMNAGFFIAAYANDIMQYPNQLPVYIGFALCFAAQHIDKRISAKKNHLDC